MIQAADSPEHAPPSLRVCEVAHSYREGGHERPVLDGVGFEARAGERIALVGRSGSGKSTLLNIIGGIDTPDRGRVVVAGRDLTAMDERERTLFRRRHVGFVYQAFNLLPTLTVGENVRLPLELNGLDPGAARRLLDEVGLADRMDDYPERLSGGEQQRVAIARALAHQPFLVLADEPTGNLDAAAGRNVLELLGRLTRTAGGILLLVTHSREVTSIADRVLVLADGRLAAGSAEAGW